MGYQKKEGVNPEVSRIAGIMGSKGGSVKSLRKLEAVRNREVYGGRPPVYHFTKKIKAVLGIRKPQPCIIPDEVGADPDFYRTKKQFPALCKGKRVFVRFVQGSAPQKGFHVKLP